MSMVMVSPAAVPITPPVRNEIRSPAASVTVVIVDDGVPLTGVLLAAGAIAAVNMAVPPPGAVPEASFVNWIVSDVPCVTTDMRAPFRRQARVAM